MSIPEPAGFHGPSPFILDRIPFEERQTLGFWKSFFQTWKLATLEPTRFYPAVGKSQDTSSAIFFYMINGMATFLTLSPLRFFAGVLLWPLHIMYGNDSVLHQGAFGGFSFLGSAFSMLFGLIFSPVLLFMLLFIFAGLTHLFLLPLRGAPQGFSATLGAFAYSSAPNVIPFVGWIWSGVLLLLALTHAHRTAPWKPLVALTLESLFLCLLLLIPLFFIAEMLLRSFSPHGSTL